MGAAVLLVDPKNAHNVGNTLRACALLGVDDLAWTGTRVASPEGWHGSARLPREERMRCYKRTRLIRLEVPRPLLAFSGRGLTPICVEVSDAAEDLRDFVHPEDAVYVFGPEDGGVPKGIRKNCHRFVRIPNAIGDGNEDARTPYNLAAAVNIVLWDRLTKATRGIKHL